MVLVVWPNFDHLDSLIIQSEFLISKRLGAAAAAAAAAAAVSTLSQFVRDSSVHKAVRVILNHWHFLHFISHTCRE